MSYHTGTQEGRTPRRQDRKLGPYERDNRIQNNQLGFGGPKSWVGLAGGWSVDFPKLGKQSGRGAKWTEIRPESDYVGYPQWRRGFLGTQWDLQKSRLQTPWRQARPWLG